MLSTVLLIVIVLILIGGVVRWGPWSELPGPVAPGQPAQTSLFHGYGHGNPVGLILIVLLIIVLLSMLDVF